MYMCMLLSNHAPCTSIRTIEYWIPGKYGQYSCMQFSCFKYTTLTSLWKLQSHQTSWSSLQPIVCWARGGVLIWGLHIQPSFPDMVRGPHCQTWSGVGRRVIPYNSVLLQRLSLVHNIPKSLMRHAACVPRWIERKSIPMWIARGTPHRVARYVYWTRL